LEREIWEWEVGLSGLKCSPSASDMPALYETSLGPIMWAVPLSTFSWWSSAS
jgi:hypothetical protein